MVLVPIDDNIAVTQVPILDPITTNSGALPPSPIGIPAIAIEIIIEVMALLLWNIPVKTTPTNNNKNGLLIDAKVLKIASFCLKSFIAAVNIFKATKINPKPDNTLPIVLTLSLLESIEINAPINASIIAIII